MFLTKINLEVVAPIEFSSIIFRQKELCTPRIAQTLEFNLGEPRFRRIARLSSLYPETFDFGEQRGYLLYVVPIRRPELFSTAVHKLLIKHAELKNPAPSLTR